MRVNETPFMVAAFVLHLALPVAAYIAPTRAPRFSPAAQTANEHQEIDVDVSNLPRQRPPPSDDNAPPPPDSETIPSDAAPRAGTVGDPRARAGSLLAPRPDATGDPNAQPDPNAPLTANQGSDTAGHVVPDVYGRAPTAAEVGGPGGPGAGPLWTRPGMVPGESGAGRAAPTRTPQRTHDPHAGTKALKAAMRKKDSKLGLDLPAASAIAAVIRGAVRASETPYECTASLTVTLSGGGKVTAVSLNSFSGGSPGAWQNVRKLVLAQLKGSSFPMKSAYAKGAIIGFGITSAKKSPGGGTGRSGLTLKFDVTDIGAHATRSVKVGWSSRPAD